MSLGSTAPVISKIRSDSVDLPWSMCAMMLRLRILLESTDEEEVATVTQGYRHAVKTLEVGGFSRPLLASIGPRAELSRTENEVVVVANIKSQIKRNKQNVVARERNKGVKSELRTRTKNAVAAVGSEDEESMLRIAIKRIDMAASKKVIHKNQAANKKSGLMKRINAIRDEA
jgi:small subunit ribosomal protein S20